MKKTFVLLLSALLLTLCASLACAEVVSTTPIVGERFWGYRVTAVAVEYDSDLAAQEFDLDTYVSTDMWDTGKVETKALTMNREVARVYTNSEAAVLAQGAAAGHYVIIEFVDDPLATTRPGEFPIRGYYTDEETGKTETPRMWKPNVGTVAQVKDITAADGTVLPAFEEMAMTNDYLFPAQTYAFELISIDLPSRPGYPYNAYVRTPENVEEGKTYPIIFCVTGGGQLEYIGHGMNNTAIPLYNDHHLYVWTETKQYGFDDEFIVVSLRHQNTSASIKIEGDDPYEDTAAAAQWIIDHYPVDKNRLFWSGQSQGSVTSLNVLWRHPELATGYFGTNGGLSPAADFSPEGWTEDLYQQTKECLQSFVDNGIKICMTFGEQDGNSANAYAAKVYYQILHDAWAEKGLSEREIDDMAKVRVFPHSTYDYAVGLTDHNVCRMMYWLDATKIDALKIVTGW